MHQLKRASHLQRAGRPKAPRGLRPLACLLALMALHGMACSKDAPSFEDVPPANELYSKGLTILEGRRIAGMFTLVDYSKAIDIFQAIIDNYPYSDFAVKAELRIADSYFEDKRYEEALSYYRDFSDLHPQHEQVPYTILRSALCHYNQVEAINRDQTATREALRFLEELIDRFPYSSEAGEGEILLRELRTRLARSMLATGDFYLKRDEFQAAAERYRTLLDTYPGLGSDAEALFKLGVCYENMKREDEALRLFLVVVENFRSSDLAILAAERIAATN